MNSAIKELMEDAEYWRQLYRCGGCTRDDAKLHIMPYINAVNNKSKELALKYNQRAKLVTFSAYVR